jgi:EAL domain
MAMYRAKLEGRRLYRFFDLAMDAKLQRRVQLESEIVGIRVALDGFGVGYAGLFHVRELQLDTIKIDRSFVTEMLRKPEDAKIVEAIVALGRALGQRRKVSKVGRCSTSSARSVVSRGKDSCGTVQSTQRRPSIRRTA